MNAFQNLLATAAVLLAGSLPAQNVIRYEAQPGGSKVRIEGTSTIHDWTVESAAVGGFMELDPAFDAGLKTPASQPKVEVTIPVRQLKSSSGKSMDAVMYEHMNQKDYPLIKYRLFNLVAKADAPSQFDATGALSVSGVTRTNTMTVTLERMDKTTIKVKGTTRVRMTDFGIKPPAPSILGMSVIRTGDEVKLSFDWTIAQPEKTAESR